MVTRSTYLMLCILGLIFLPQVFAGDTKTKTLNILPESCDSAKILVVKSKLALTSATFPVCTRLIVKSGGSLHWDVSSISAIVVIVEKGGKLKSEEDLYAIINKGGTVEVLDGRVKHFHAAAGINKITSEAEIESQTGSATIELDNSIAKN